MSSQLYAAYARVSGTWRSLASVIGEDEIAELDRQYLKFGKSFENEFLKQRSNENRDMEPAWIWHGIYFQFFRVRADSTLRGRIGYVV